MMPDQMLAESLKTVLTLNCLTSWVLMETQGATSCVNKALVIKAKTKRTPKERSAMREDTTLLSPTQDSTVTSSLPFTLLNSQKTVASYDGPLREHTLSF
eukprot:TRINITY_DN1473_c0_g2_i2.p2 TRINITY_DN1473_c0_g2~~TRINITY_DN1473_c0_g2_i2.p2  ORF type:complete len:100 (+),score=0.19 TRINITY_DN1473_c0_g2_i2:1475-1774(+)